MPPADGAIGSRCATHGSARRARRAIRSCAAVLPVWPAGASVTAAQIRHRSTGRRTRHRQPVPASLVSRPSPDPNMLLSGDIDSYPSRMLKHTFKTASQHRWKGREGPPSETLHVSTGSRGRGRATAIARVSRPSPGRVARRDAPEPAVTWLRKLRKAVCLTLLGALHWQFGTRLP